MANAAGRTDSWKRSRRPGSGVLRDTSTASRRRPASHTSPRTTVTGMFARNPTCGAESSRSPMSETVPSPSETAKECRAKAARAIRAIAHSTASRAAQPASSRALATARCRRGRRKPSAMTTAPASVTERGSTVSPALVSAMSPASPESSTEPPTAMTTTAATTDGKGASGQFGGAGGPQPQGGRDEEGHHAGEHCHQCLEPAVRGTGGPVAVVDLLVAHAATLSSRAALRPPGGPTASACEPCGYGAHNGREVP